MIGRIPHPKMFMPFAILLAICVVRGQAQEPREDRVDFRGRKIDENLFAFVGPYAKRQIKEEAGGLRIVLPAEFAKPAPTGLLWKSRVAGDFEITLSYELLKANRPTKGGGVGVNLYLKTDTPKDEAVLLSRIHQVKGGNVYFCTRTTVNKEGNRQADKTAIPTEALSGMLRLTRRGREVAYSVAEGDKADFRRLHAVDLGTEEVKYLRIAVDPGGSESPVEARLRSFVVKQQMEPVADAPPPKAPAQDEPSSSKWPLYLLALIGLIVLGCGGWFCWRSFAKSAPKAN